MEEVARPQRCADEVSKPTRARLIPEASKNSASPVLPANFFPLLLAFGTVIRPTLR